jgi:hypothetical protein
MRRGRSRTGFGERTTEIRHLWLLWNRYDRSTTMSVQWTPEEKAAGAAAGTALGVASGLLGNVAIPPAYGVPAVIVAPAIFARATTHALRHNAPFASALRAGATAVVGGPAVVAAASAVAPVVLTVVGVAVLGAAGYLLYALLANEESKPARNPSRQLNGKHVRVGSGSLSTRSDSSVKLPHACANPLEAGAEKSLH